ncbi:hypothetical protein Tco_0493467 [Tanacetum coccineum]
MSLTIFVAPIIKEWTLKDEVSSKVPTAKPTVAAVKGNRGKVVKASTCWIWKPKQNQLDQGLNLNGVSAHVLGNISPTLYEYEPYVGGIVSFGHGGGKKFTGKCVNKICDNKNSVLFTDSEYLVLGKDFKLDDDSHVLLRTPRQQNMYSI